MTHFVILAIVPYEPECRLDSDCLPKMSCIQETCQNPCVVANPCERSQECSVTDSSVGRPVVACSCPDYNIVDEGGYCRPGMNCFFFISISSLYFEIFHPSSGTK